MTNLSDMNPQEGDLIYDRRTGNVHMTIMKDDGLWMGEHAPISGSNLPHASVALRAGDERKLMHLIPSTTEIHKAIKASGKKKPKDIADVVSVMLGPVHAYAAKQPIGK